MYAGLVDEEVAKAFNNAISELEECGAEVVDIDISTFTYDEFFRVKGENDLTAVIYPTMLSGSLPSGTLGPGQSLASTHDTLNRLSDLCTSLGLPEMTVPIGNESDGCGIGMEILADKYEEQTLLDLAYSYMSRYDHRKEPDPE